MENGSFYGSAGQPVRFQDVVLTETSYADGFVVPHHVHTHPLFVLVLDGAPVEHVEGRSRELAPSSAFFHPAEASHSESFAGDRSRLFNMQLGGDWLNSMARFCITLPAEHTPFPAGRTSALAAQIHEEFLGGREPLVLEGLMLAMIGTIVPQPAPRERRGTPGWMDEVIERLHAHSTEEVGLAELAGLVQVHPSYLARTFRAAHGCSVGQYVRALRVRRAMELLRSGTLPLSRVALMCGFADQSHFTRVFRSATGVTPATFRRRSR